MHHINVEYPFRVLELKPKGCPYPIRDKNAKRENEDVLMEDGVRIELLDATGTKHRITFYTTIFPLIAGIDDCSRNPPLVKPGATGMMTIKCGDPICIDVKDFM